MLNPTEVMNHIKFELGLETFPLDKTEEDILKNVIQKVTIPDFSVHYPNEVFLPLRIHPSNVVPLPDNDHTYYINTKSLGDDVTILGVTEITSEEGGVFNTGGFGQYHATSATDLMMAQAYADVGSIIPYGPMWEFMSPNQLKLHNGADLRFGDGHMLFLRCITTHPYNMSTIENTKRVYFLELATLDVKRYLYKLLKRYNRINTGVGEIELFIDEWEGADAERKEFMRELEEKAVLDRPVKIMTI